MRRRHLFQTSLYGIVDEIEHASYEAGKLEVLIAELERPTNVVQYFDFQTCRPISHKDAIAKLKRKREAVLTRMYKLKDHLVSRDKPNAAAS